MADVSVPVRVETGWTPATLHGPAPALYRIPVTLSLLGLVVVAVQAGQPAVGLASMMAVLATAAALSLRAMSRRYAPAAILRDQGDAKMANGRYAEARSFYERALAIVQRQLPPGSAEVMLTTYNLAVVSSILGDHDRAGACLDAIFAGLDGRVPCAWAGRLAWLLRRVSRHHSLHGRHTAAIRACERAADLVGDAPGADDRTVRSLVTDLAWARHWAGELDAAESDFRRALAIHERYRDVALALAQPGDGQEGPPRSPYRAPGPRAASTSGGPGRAVAHSLVGLGWTLVETGRFSEADRCLARAGVLVSSRAGSEALALHVEAIRGRAAVAIARGLFDEAAHAYRGAAEALEETQTPQAIALLLDQAWVLCLQDDGPNADGHLVTAQQLLLQGGPGQRAQRSFLHFVWAEIRRRQGDHKTAHGHAQRSLSLAAESCVQHPSRAAMLSVASRIHTARSEFALAERAARDALELLRARLVARSHPRFAGAYFALGEVQAARAEWEAAEHAFRAALHVREQAYGVQHPALAEVCEGLRGVYEATGQREHAQACVRRLSGWTRRENAAAEPRGCPSEGIGGQPGQPTTLASHDDPCTASVFAR